MEPYSRTPIGGGLASESWETVPVYQQAAAPKWLWGVGLGFEGLGVLGSHVFLPTALAFQFSCLACI